LISSSVLHQYPGQRGSSSCSSRENIVDILVSREPKQGAFVISGVTAHLTLPFVTTATTNDLLAQSVMLGLDLFCSLRAHLIFFFYDGLGANNLKHTG
jgi:hypothetical protein